MKTYSRVHAQNIVAWAKDKPEVVVLSADLTSSCEADAFRDTYPDRFFSLGIAEQNMMSWAAGMAREGFVPFVHTFAVFIYRRAYDQVAMSIAYANLPVKMIGFLPGITTPGGASHQAIDDISLMRTLPNMTVLETGDASDVESVLEAAYNINGPVYVRMLRGEMPRLFPDKIVFNQARVLAEGTDITLLSSGICTEEAMRATRLLSAKGIGIQHLHVTTLKPFSDPIVLEALHSAKHGIITMENHLVTGGLGTCTAELMATHGIGKKLIRIGINDVFAHGASRPYLMQEYGLDAMNLVKAVGQLWGKDLRITEDELSSVRIEAVHSDAKPEAL